MRARSRILFDNRQSLVVRPRPPLPSPRRALWLLSLGWLCLQGARAHAETTGDEPESPAAQAHEDPCADATRAARYQLKIEPHLPTVTAGSVLRLVYRARDQWGCGPSERPTLAAHAGPFLLVGHFGARNELSVHIADDAAEGEHELTLRLHGAEAKTRVHVISAARARRLFPSEPALSAELTDNAAELQDEAPERHASAQPASKSWLSVSQWSRTRVFMALLSLLSLLLGLGALWLLRRRAQRRAAMPAPSPQQALSPQQAPSPQAAAAPRPAGALRCPSCELFFPPPALFCPHDGTQLQPPSAPPEPTLSCPVCRRGFAARVRVCPEHHEELLSPESLPMAPRARPQARICPRCAARFSGPMRYCGRDGAELVTLN